MHPKVCCTVRSLFYISALETKYSRHTLGSFVKIEVTTRLDHKINVIAMHVQFSGLKRVGKCAAHTDIPSGRKMWQ